MAGIGFTLRRLTQRNDLLGVAQGYIYSALVATGPWLFTILSLSMITLISGYWLRFEQVAVFRIIVIYNFAFSLVFTAPIFMLITRYLADLIFMKDVHKAPGMMLGALATVYLTQLPIVGWFYFFYVDINDSLRFLALINYFLVASLWVVAVFLSALKAYATITRTFAIGLVVALASTTFFVARLSVSGMLLGFSIGLMVILFSLIAHVLAEYPYAIHSPFAFLGYMKKYWELAVGGLAYNTGIWVDKWMMWFSPQATQVVPGMPSYQDYDSAMFLAFLTIIPSLAMFLVSVETSFYERYLHYYRDIQRHANYRRIQKNLQALLSSLANSSRNIAILQGSVSLLFILLAPRLFDLFDISFNQMGMFRFGVLGAFFHVMMALLLIILTYFDMRRLVLLLQVGFLVLNIAFTWLSMQLGFVFYGGGYFLAVLIMFCIVYLAATYTIQRLNYQTFIRTNLSIKSD